MEKEMKNMNIKIDLCKLLGAVNCMVITDILKEKGDDTKLKGYGLFTTIVLLLYCLADFLDVIDKSKS